MLGTTQYPGVRINHITPDQWDADRTIFQTRITLTVHQYTTAVAQDVTGRNNYWNDWIGNC